MWCCPYSSSYELRYDIVFYSLDGLCSAIALASYSVSDSVQVAALVLGAVDTARTLLLDRN